MHSVRSTAIRCDRVALIIALGLLALTGLDFSLFKTQSAFADPSHTSMRAYGTINQEGNAYGQLTSDGGSIIVGWIIRPDSDQDVWIVKLDSDGAIEWQKAYPSQGEENMYAVVQTSDGGYIAAGDTRSVSSNGAQDAWVIKLDSTGEVEWQKAFGVDEEGTGDRTDDSGESVIQTSDGGYMVAGTRESLVFDDLTVWLIKLDSNGEVEWQKTYGGLNQARTKHYNALGSSVQQTIDGGYIVGGTVFGTGTQSCEFLVLKVDADGKIEWQKAYGGGDCEQAETIQQTSEGGYIISGITRSDSPGGADTSYWVLKLDSLGGVEWEKAYGRELSDGLPSIQQTSDGGYIVTGTTNTIVPGNLFADLESWTVKLDADGNIEWQKLYGGSGLDGTNTVQHTESGGYFLTGFTESFGAGENDVWILRTDGDGNIEDCTPNLVKEGEGSVMDTEAHIVTLFLPTLLEDVEPVDTEFGEIVTDAEDPVRCPPEKTLGTTLFEASDAVDQDDTVDYRGDVLTRAFTDRADVETVRIELLDPDGDVRETRVETEPIDSVEHPPLCGDFGKCVEYVSTFEGIVDERGFWTARATFLDTEGNPIEEAEKSVRVDSFFVLPESPIGVAALIMSSLAVLGGFMFLKKRSQSNTPI